MSSKQLILGLIPACVLCVLSIAGPVSAQEPDKSIEPFAIKIDYEQEIFQGHYVSLDITKLAGTEEMHGFDFLIGYDTSALSFIGADGEDLFDINGDYRWEHFEYHQETPVSCDSGWCPSGLVRAVGVADLNDGDHHPLDLSPEDGTSMFMLIFLVTEDPVYECMFTPVRFFWIDCGDNTLAVDMPPTIGLAMSDDVFDWGGAYPEIDDPAFGFPGYFGAPDSCLIDSTVTTRFVDFYNGGVDIICIDSIDQRGDINHNGIANEIADWVMYTNYFLFGFQAFGSHIEPSIAASDVNADGIVLSVMDLIYLCRVIYGCAPPFPAPSFDATEADTLFIIQDLSTKTISVDYADTLAGLLLIFDGDITPEFLINTEENLCSHWYDGRNTSVLIQPIMDEFEPCGVGFTGGPILTYTGSGRLRKFEDSQYRITGAADFNNSLFTPDYINGNLIIEITGGHDGMAYAGPDPMPRWLARIGESETVEINIGDFDEHIIDDVDLASLRINDTIVPLSTSFTPPHIVVSAQSFIDSYYFGPDTSMAEPWNDVLDTLSTRLFVLSVSGDFTDATSFISLGDVIMFDEPVTIPVPSGWATIGAAVEAAESHDTIEVAPGIYTGDGNRDISLGSKSLVIRSVGGPEMTKIDCGGSVSEPHRAFISTVEDESGSIIDGFNIINGYHENGGAISLIHSDLTIRNCILQLNESNRGGALYIQEASPTIERCLFFHDQAEEGGAIHCWATANPNVRNCTFSNNTGTVNGAALYCYNSSPVLENNLIAFNNPGETVYLFDGGSDPQFSCCDIYGNDGGDWTGGIAGQLGINGNFSEDPMFCDTTYIDFHLDGASPCAANNNICLSLIGLYDVNCGVRCGDINSDGFVNIGDAVYLISYLFRNGPAPLDLEASDLNGNMELDVGDAVYLINFIFRDGPPLECANK